MWNALYKEIDCISEAKNTFIVAQSLHALPTLQIQTYVHLQCSICAGTCIFALSAHTSPLVDKFAMEPTISFYKLVESEPQ